MLNRTDRLRTSSYLQGKEKVLLMMQPYSTLAVQDGTPSPINSIKAAVPHESGLDSLHFETPKVYHYWKFNRAAKSGVLKSD